MSKLAQFLKSTVGAANPAKHANPENDKSHVPRANPANPDDAGEKISSFSNFSSGVVANSLLPDDLAPRIRAMAMRWGYSADELAEELARAATDPAKALQWVERDEAKYGGCQTPADLATQYARIRQGDQGDAQGRLGTQAEESPAAPLSPAQEAARREVLAQLGAHPNISRAFVNRFEPNGDMVVTLGIRDVGTGELKIPAERFNQDTLDDYGALLNIIGGAAT